jgi:hypothetical protein
MRKRKLQKTFSSSAMDLNKKPIPTVLQASLNNGLKMWFLF